MLTLVWNYPVTLPRLLALLAATSHAAAIRAVCDCPLAEAVMTVVCGSAAALTVRAAYRAAMPLDALPPLLF